MRKDIQLRNCCNNITIQHACIVHTACYMITLSNCFSAFSCFRKPPSRLKRDPGFDSEGVTVCPEVIRAFTSTLTSGEDKII